MSETPLFSIIIPTKDRARLLNECISSVLKQSFANYQLIVVDDGSTDNTRHVVDSIHDSRILYHRQEHSEKSYARNKGLSLAVGKYVCFIDDDDLLDIRYLENFAAAIEKNVDRLYIYRTGYVRLEKHKEIAKPQYNESVHHNPVRFAAYNMCGIWSLCIPREFLKEDLFPTDFPHWQDTHLILRLFSKHPLIQLPNHLYNYRIHNLRGSIKVVSEDALLERAQSNTKAIEHFFNNHGDLVESHLPKRTRNFLVAEKKIQYSLLAKKHGYNNLAKQLIKDSKEAGLFLQLWKSYLLYFFGK